MNRNLIFRILKKFSYFLSPSLPTILSSKISISPKSRSISRKEGKIRDLTDVSSHKSSKKILIYPFTRNISKNFNRPILNKFPIRSMIHTPSPKNRYVLERRLTLTFKESQSMPNHSSTHVSSSLYCPLQK